MKNLSDFRTDIDDSTKIHELEQLAMDSLGWICWVLKDCEALAKQYKHSVMPFSTTKTREWLTEQFGATDDEISQVWQDKMSEFAPEIATQMRAVLAKLMAKV